MWGGVGEVGDGDVLSRGCRVLSLLSRWSATEMPV